jgi:hypothetical protein
MSKQCESDIIKFKQGETTVFKLFLKRRVSGVLKDWVFPADNANIAALTLTVPGESGTPVVFEFDNGSNSPTNPAITFEGTDKEDGAITVTLSDTQTPTVKDNDEDCPQSMQVKVDQTDGARVVKCFDFIEKLDVRKPMFE